MMSGHTKEHTFSLHPEFWCEAKLVAMDYIGTKGAHSDFHAVLFHGARHQGLTRLSRDHLFQPNNVLSIPRRKRDHSYGRASFNPLSIPSNDESRV